MELSVIRRETTGSPPNQYNESETITKFEIMDGAPVRGKPLSDGSVVMLLRVVRRRNDTYTVVLGRFRSNSDIPGREQEI